MRRRFVSAVVILWTLRLALANAESSSDGASGFKVSEVHGAKTRSGRQLQSAFGASSIVPLVIDDSPCVSFNADDSSPVLDSDGNVLGYVTVHSNNYDAAGLSILRVDIVILSFNAEYYFASVNTSATNVRALLTTGLPNACPSTTPAAHTYSQGLTVDCSKRRATLDMSVPTSLFNCTTATTEDFSVVFFLQLELDLAPKQCAASKTPFYAGGIYNTMPYGSGCSYVMVTAACKPSTCLVDTSSLDEAEQLNKALGATGRIAGSSVQRARSAYDAGLSNVNTAVVGGLVGGVLLAAAVMVVYVLLRRRSAGSAVASHHGRRSHSVASDYLDADRFDSFSIDTTSVSTGSRRQAHRASRLSSTSRLYSMSRPSVLRAMGAGRWRDKFGISPSPVPADASGGAATVAFSVAGDTSVAGGNQLLPAGLYTASTGPAAGAAAAGSVGGSVSMSQSPFSLSNTRLPSIFSSQRVPSVFAQPRHASMVGMPVPVPSVVLGPGRSGLSMSRVRRGSTLVPAPAVPMVFDRAAASAALGGSPSDGVAIPADLEPPDDASSVFLNPLALFRGGRSKDRSGSSSPRMLPMATFSSSAVAGVNPVPARRTPPRGTLTSLADDRSDGPLIRMIVEEEAQGTSGSSESSARPTATGAGDGSTVHHGTGAGTSGSSAGMRPSLTQAQLPGSRQGGAGGVQGPGPVAESTALAGDGLSPRAAVGEDDSWGRRSGFETAPVRRRSSQATSSSGSSSGSVHLMRPGNADAQSSEGGCLRSILPCPPPLELPPAVDAAAAVVAASPASARLARPSRDMRAALSSSSQSSIRSLQSQTSSRSASSGAQLQPRGSGS